MNELVKVDPKEFGLEESKANELTIGLKTILEERKVLIDSYIETIELEITEENLPTFKELRIKIRDNRTKGIEPWHKVNKQFFLTGGRFVDAIKNKEVAENERMEAKLMEAEKYFENLEKERIDNLTAERYEACLPFVNDMSLILPNLGSMPESLWDNYIIGLKASFEAKKAEDKRIEDERIAAEKAEIERQKAIEAENKKLKAEREANEKKQEAERLERERLAKVEAEKISKRNKELQPYITFIRDYDKMLNMSDADYKKEFSEIKIGAEQHYEYERQEIIRKAKEEEAATKLCNKKIEDRRLNAIQFLFDHGFENTHGGMNLKSQSHFIGANHYSQLESEKEFDSFCLDVVKSIENFNANKAKDEALNKLKAKQESEQKEKEEAEALKQAELNKGDSDKEKDLINDLTLIKTKYSFKSAKNVKKYNGVSKLLDKVIDYINN